MGDQKSKKFVMEGKYNSPTDQSPTGLIQNNFDMESFFLEHLSQITETIFRPSHLDELEKIQVEFRKVPTYNMNVDSYVTINLHFSPLTSEQFMFIPFDVDLWKYSKPTFKKRILSFFL